MLTREIVRHVKMELRKGVSKEVVREELSKKDLTEKEITHALHLAEALLEHEKANNTHVHEESAITHTESPDVKKNIALLLSAIVIGYVIGQGFYFGLIHYMVLFSGLLSLWLSKIILLNPFTPIFAASLFAYIIISVGYAVFAYIKNNWWWKVFQPTGVKIAYTFLTFFVLCALYVVVTSGVLGLYSLTFDWLSFHVYFIPLSSPFWYILNFIVYFFLLYPFAALLSSLRATKMRENLAVIVLLLIFNPIVFNIANSGLVMSHNFASFSRMLKTEYKCGIQDSQAYCYK